MTKAEMASEPIFDKRRPGPLRGLLRTIDRAVQAQVEERWEGPSEPRADAAAAIATHAGMTCTGKEVPREVVYRTAAENSADR